MTLIGTADGSVVPDVTMTGKEHFEVLDGLRGSAASRLSVSSSCFPSSCSPEVIPMRDAA